MQMTANSPALARVHTLSGAMQLVGGQLVEVPATLIKRQKFHFHHLEALGKLRLSNGGPFDDVSA